MRQNMGASVPDQALAVPATPLRVDGPAGFDPSRFRNQLDRLRDSQAIPQPNGRVEVDCDALCDVLVAGHDTLELTERMANIDYYEGNCGVLLDEIADAIAMEARQGGNAEERSHAEHDSAGLEEASPDTSSQTPAPKE